MAIRGLHQRESGVTHLIAEHLIDLSDVLRSVGDRDGPFSMRHAATIGTRNRLREGPKEIAGAPPAEVLERRTVVPTMRIATRDFH